MAIVPGIFSFLVGAAGWYYAVHAHAAGRLAEVEGNHANRWRIALRRAGGVVMLALALCFFVAAAHRAGGEPTQLALAALLATPLLLLLILGLVGCDIVLTLRMRRRVRERLGGHPGGHAS
ncbi:MAG: hypothetical protein ACFCVE_10620 [Phycisphaerae bacterium]